MCSGGGVSLPCADGISLIQLLTWGQRVMYGAIVEGISSKQRDAR